MSEQPDALLLLLGIGMLAAGFVNLRSAYRAYQGDPKHTWDTGMRIISIRSIVWGSIFTLGGTGAVLAYLQVPGFG